MLIKGLKTRLLTRKIEKKNCSQPLMIAQPQFLIYLVQPHNDQGRPLPPHHNPKENKHVSLQHTTGRLFKKQRDKSTRTYGSTTRNKSSAFRQRTSLSEMLNDRSWST